LRTFVRGTPSVPATGMGDIPRQLAGWLPDGTVHTDAAVAAVSPTTVHLDDGRTITAPAVVVATDPRTASTLLPSLPTPVLRSVTTYYHATDETLLGGDGVLVIDGERRGPVINTVPISNAARAYAPEDTTLVSSSVLGLHSEVDEGAVRKHLAVLYAADTRRWTLLRCYAIADAVPAMPPPHDFRKPVRIEPGLYVCGDARDSSSIQGAMVSGRRAAEAILEDLPA
jgi:Flavin containing amine oxidoreductase